VPRRTFLADVGMGFAGLALGAMLQRDGIVRAATDAAWVPPDGRPHFAPKAKRVIWVFLSGGYSHVETFDPKPALNQYAGKSFADTPFENPVASPLTIERARSVVAGAAQRDAYGSKARIFPLQVGFKKHGQSGIEMSDWWPHLATCVDDLAIVRSMFTTDEDHAAENQIHTGRHHLDETQPSIGAWVHYGLGSLNDNLPQFVVLGDFKDTRIRQNFQSLYLGPEHAGIQLAIDPKNPLPFGAPPPDVLPEEQRNEYALINRLNNLAAVEYPDDPVMRARIRSYELAYGMQMAVPEALDLADETEATLSLYGLENEETRPAGERCLAARRLAERGTRFILVYLSRYGEWDSHLKLRENHSQACARADKPVAGLLKDLKQRGLLDDTLVVFCTEFGRTPALEPRGDNDGRDHHPFGFSIWFAGAGIKGGTVHGATDELGYHVVEHPHYVTDIHATVLHLMGLDPRRLDIPGRKRLEIDYGRAITPILA
jgi:hypothetical protein